MNHTLCNQIDWVGAVDWNIRDFHSYQTDRGATYNAYLVRDEKTALIDTVKAPFAGELLKNIASLTDLSRVDYVVCNHAELDHAGALPEVMRAVPQAILVCDKKCAATLAEYCDTSDWKMQIVASGDRLRLGRRTLQFVETPMAHWPESMATYVPEEKLLFSMDIFGQHYATSQRFDDEVDFATVMDEAKTYYANIVVPYGQAVLKTLERLAGVDIGMIAPSHGLIWRTHAGKIVAAYRDWATQHVKPKVLVLYDTMWESTAAMAHAILEGATRPGVSALLMHVRRTNLTRIATEALDAAAIAFGSATLNRGMMPMAAAALNYLEGLRPQGKAAVAFGSYGWGVGGAEAIQESLRRLEWEIVSEPLRARWRPTPEVLAQCRRVGELLAERAVAISQANGT
ncbi:MAG: FprA family A-type flavoprotein [Planctomycetaceae bacterium]|nr:FprA family A-type flavoprotein [Planctomycetaceae bacterium]